MVGGEIMRQDDHATPLSRRELGRIAVASLTGALTAAAVTTQAQAPTTPPEIPADTRLAALERSLGRTLSEEQRKAVLANIRFSEDAWAKCRKEFKVPDGTEPDFVFRPHPRR
jgi:hypothetical protein